MMSTFTATCASHIGIFFEAIRNRDRVGITIGSRGQITSIDLHDEDALKLRDWLTDAFRGTDARPHGVVVSFEKPPTLPLRADEWDLVWSRGDVPHGWDRSAWLVAVSGGDHPCLWARRRGAQK